MAESLKRAEAGVLGWIDRDITGPIEDFQDPSQEWRRLVSELLRHLLPGVGRRRRRDDGTGVPEHHQPHGRRGGPRPDGAGDHPVHGQGVRCPSQPRGEHRVLASRGLPVAACPRLRRGAAGRRRAAAWFLQAVVGVVGDSYGSNYPATGYSAMTAFVMETVLTLGLVSVILGTASGAQNLGVIGAIGVGAYIALAGLWGSHIRRLDEPRPHLRTRRRRRQFRLGYWVYVVGPLLGAALAVGRPLSCSEGPGGRARRLRSCPGRTVHADPRSATRPERACAEACEPDAPN